MAKRIVWSIRAQTGRQNILAYWRIRNKSSIYSIKLNRLFKESVQVISKFPHIGTVADERGVRIKTVKEYLIFYEQTETQVVVLSIWDSRQDPESRPERPHNG
jgi:plasmid stabilization system protein ParE